MRERRWLLLALYGLVLAVAVSGALKATRPKFKIATTSTTTSTTEEPDVADNEDGEAETTTSSDVNATTSRVLTGIPQIDYIWDPNLPRELNGYNLSEYPFYNSIPEEIDFKCDGLHDGFYASVIHKCQVYHHCLFGTRYDFLCANFTAFDQRTFICHFASEVDCANSKKYWHRNDALYKAAETTTMSTTSTSTTTTTTLPPPPGLRPGGRRRRPYRRRPAYDYYEEEYYDDEAYERTRPRGYDRRDDYDYDDRKYTRRDRERDRNFRDRDYREREPSRTRDSDRPLRESEKPVKDEPPLSPRERFPSRNNRRDPVRTSAGLPRDPILEDEPRLRNRDPDPPITRTRESDESTVDDRRPLDTRNREVDDRRYTDKGYTDDYEDEPISAGPALSSVTSDVLVKPAAPVSSVYSRPRAPPKIRRPVPITEQDKFAYKATSAPPIAGVEARRRPVEIPAEDDYYEDELEEVRPRRPATRRRPGFRDFYENPRERDRDRPFRTRYREDGEDLRSRKYPERNRDRYYERGAERGRDRSLDRTGDRGSDRIAESTRNRTGGRLQESDRPNAGRAVEREHDVERPRSSSRSKESVESLETTRRSNVYERTSVAPSTSTLDPVKDDFSSQNSSNQSFRNSYRQDNQSPAGRNIPIKSEHQPVHHQSTSGNVRDQTDDEYLTETEKHSSSRLESKSRDEVPHSKESNKPRNEAEEYWSADEEYDESEYQSTPPPTPRTSVRIVKRPFLPSRGGNPNPRGLSLVGSKATDSSSKQEASLDHSSSAKSSTSHSEGYEVAEQEQNGEKTNERGNANNRHNYDAYRSIRKDAGQKTRSDEYEQAVSRPATRRPLNDDSREHEELPAIDHTSTEQNHDETLSMRVSTNGDDTRTSTSRNAHETRGRYSNKEEVSDDRDKLAFDWNRGEYRMEEQVDVRRGPETKQSENSGPHIRPKSRITENSGYHDSSYANENNERNQQAILPSGKLAASKQTLNEVVTHDRLQDIPESEYDVTLNEALTPSFTNQEANLPSGFVLPIHRQLGRDSILQSTENSYKAIRPYDQRGPAAQSQQQHQQQQQKPFVPSQQFLPIEGTVNDDNERSRFVQYLRTPETVHVTGPQYRHQRGPWHDYTGY